MKTYIFKVVIEEDCFPDGKKAYSAYCPALEGCNTWGYTPEEALANIKEAVEGHVECLLDHGDPIPEDIIEQEQETIQPSLFDAKDVGATPRVCLESFLEIVILKRFHNFFRSRVKNQPVFLLSDFFLCLLFD